jgi:hypothetical protein
MKTLIHLCVYGMLAFAATSVCALAQSPTGPEARLKERNLILPPVPPPVANYVDSVQSGKLLFLAGNTAGPQWKSARERQRMSLMTRGHDGRKRNRSIWSAIIPTRCRRALQSSNGEFLRKTRERMNAPRR